MLRRFLFIQETAVEAIAHTFNSLLGYDGNLSKDKVGLQTRQIQKGRAYGFNGANQYVQLPNNPIFNLVDFTISVKFIAGSINNTRLVSKDNAGDPGIRKLISIKGLSPLGVPGAGILVGPNFLFIDGPTTLTPGQHYTMSLVRKDGQYLKLYINKILVGQVNSGLFLGPIDSNVGPTLGNYRSNSANGEHFDGSLYDVRMYNIVKTDAEIINIENGGLDNIGLVAHYKADESTGILSYDSSGNGLHGSLINGVTHTTLTNGFGADFQNQVGYTSGMYFNGSTSATYAPIVLGLADFSIRGSIERTTNGGFHDRIISNGTDGLATTRQIAVDVFDNRLRFGQGGAQIIRSTTQLISGTTYRFEVRRVSGVLTIYINGVLENTVAFVRDYNTANETVIGSYGTSGSGNFLGTISSLVVQQGASTLEINPATITTNNGMLVSFIPRNEAIPTKDVLGNPLQYSGRVKYDAELIGRAIRFDGVDDIIGINTDLGGTDNFSVSFWYKPTSSAYRSIMSSGPNLSFPKVLIYKTADNRISMYRSNYSYSVEKVIVNQRNFVVITSTGPSTTYYINSNVGYTVPQPYGAPAGSVFYIGTGYRGRTIGDMYDIRFFNYSLTQANVDSLFAGNYNGSPIARYKLDEGSGTTAYDSSGNGRHGAIYGGISNITGKGLGTARQKSGHTQSGLVTIPRNEAIPTQDVLGNTLQYPGDGFSLLPSGQVDFNPGLAPELIRKTVPTSYTYGNALPITMKKKVQTNKENDFIVLP